MKLTLSLLALAASTFAQGPSNGRYVVEFRDEKDSAAFIEKAKQYGKVSMNMSHSLFKGVSFKFNDPKAAQEVVRNWAASPEVKNIWPVVVGTKAEVVSDEKNEKRQEPTSSSSSSSLSSSSLSSSSSSSSSDSSSSLASASYEPYVMSQVDKLHAKGFTGKGFKIAIIDSGVDYTNPALGGCFGKPSCTVIGGYDLVGDNFNEDNDPEPDDDPLDQMGMGTTTAGIIFAQKSRLEGFTGVAPGAKMLSYKVFGPSGLTRSDVLISALNRAYDDGPDLILIAAANFVGGGWSQDPLAEAASRIVANGIPVISSIGEYYDQASFKANVVPSGPGTTSVTAVWNNKMPTLLYLNNTYSVGSGPSSSSENNEFTYQTTDYNIPEKSTQLNLPLYATSLNATNGSDACAALPDSTPDLSGSIVLIRRGDCSISTKSTNAKAKGAKYFLFYGDKDGLWDETIYSYGDFSGYITKELGERWIAKLSKGDKITVNLSTFSKESSMRLAEIPGAAKGGSIYGSQWGPNFGMDLTPKFAAPGHQIVTTAPKRDFTIYEAWFTNTFPYYTYAAAHIAGVYALIGEARGTKNLKDVERSLMATAKAQLFFDFKQFQPFLAPVPQQGAGLIQAYDAAFLTTSLEPSSISFNDTENFLKQAQIKIVNNHKNKAITFKLSNLPAKTFYALVKDPYAGGDVAYPPDFGAASAQIDLSETSVTIQPGQSKTITVKATQPQGLSDLDRLPIWSGYIAVNGTDGSALTVPYQGAATALRSIKQFSDKHTPQMLIPRYTLRDGAILSFPRTGPRSDLSITCFSRLGSAQVTIELLDLNQNKTIGIVESFPQAYVPRLGFGYKWIEGKMADGNTIPIGKYRMLCKALRVNGDEKNPDDWDSQTGILFNVVKKED